VSVRAPTKNLSTGGDVAWILRQLPGIDKGTGRSSVNPSISTLKTIGIVI
jgi:hypothetical protein